MSSTSCGVSGSPLRSLSAVLNLPLDSVMLPTPPPQSLTNFSACHTHTPHAHMHTRESNVTITYQPHSFAPLSTGREGGRGGGRDRERERGTERQRQRQRQRQGQRQRSGRVRAQRVGGETGKRQTHTETTEITNTRAPAWSRSQANPSPRYPGRHLQTSGRAGNNTGNP